MNFYLMSLGFKVWRSFEKNCKVPDDLPIDRDELDQYEANAKSLNAILSGLKNVMFVKVMQFKTTKHAWEKLKTDYEGASKVKQSKIQTYKGQFESLQMKEEEEDNIVDYILRVYEIVNSIRGLGGLIKERKVVDKLHRTMPIKYDSKVSTLEERDDLDLMKVHELHGIFTTYQMRTGKK